MKVLQISSAKTFGNWERHFVELCRGLHNRGHEVFAVIRPSSDWKDRLDFLPEENILYVSVRNSFGVLSAQKIAKFIRNNNIEIAHTHVARDYFSAALACRIAKTPKLVLTRYSPSPMKSFYRFCLSNLDKAIAVSDGIQEDLQRIFPEEKIAFVANGFEMQQISDSEREKSGKDFRSEHTIPTKSFLVGAIGDLKEANGQRDFVLAANIVAEKFPEAYFAIVGEDNSANQAFRRELRRTVKVFGLENRFLWLNWVEDKSKFFNALDVFVVPPHERSFALNILEAMAHRTAIVGTETVSAKDILQNNSSGLLVAPQQPTALADAINRLLGNEALRKNLGRNAQLSIRESFNLPKMIEETEKVYFSLF